MRRKCEGVDILFSFNKESLFNGLFMLKETMLLPTRQFKFQHCADISYFYIKCNLIMF